MATQCVAQFEQFAWSLTSEAIGQALRKRYAVRTDLPPKLLALVRKLAAVEDKRHFCTPVRTLDAVEGNYLLRYVSPVGPRSVGPSDTDWLLPREARARKGGCNEHSHNRCHYRRRVHGWQCTLEHEQSLQERLSRMVRSDVHHRTTPRKNSASYLILLANPARTKR
jgi:hypothetical protein